MSDMSFDPAQLGTYAQGLAGFVRQTEKWTDSLRGATHLLEEMRRNREHEYIYEVRRLREDFDILIRHLERLGVPGPDMYGEKLERVRSLLATPEWPQAVDPDYLVQGPESRRSRAALILDLFLTEDLRDVKLLDYGCGDGTVVQEAISRGTAVTLGYDIDRQWDNDPNLTTDLTVVHERGPYDLILMYDVLDHSREPVKDLATAASVLAPGGRIYLRTHPWCGKHGGHLYERINKAYAHVLFDEVEQLRLFGKAMDFVHKFTDPLGVYAGWIRDAGLKVLQESPVVEKDGLHPFFCDAANIQVQERIAQHWKGKDFRRDMTLNFVNYVITVDRSQQHVL